LEWIEQATQELKQKTMRVNAKKTEKRRLLDARLTEHNAKELPHPLSRRLEKSTSRIKD
jgi:hypothetical protein